MNEVIAADAIHLWIAPMRAWDATQSAYYESLLSAAEWARYRGFAFDDVRREFLLGRALVRLALSQYAGVAPERWRFALGAHGKPEVALPTSLRNLRFNLSHSHGLLACAVTRRRLIGVDVEYVKRAVNCEELARSNFSPVEVEEMMALPAGARRLRFFEYWVLKESYVKARGLGLQLPLEQFWMDVTDPAAPRISWSPGAKDDSTQWRFGLLQAGADHLLAISVEQTDDREPPFITHTVHRMAADGLTYGSERRPMGFN